MVNTISLGMPHGTPLDISKLLVCTPFNFVFRAPFYFLHKLGASIYSFYVFFCIFALNNETTTCSLLYEYEIAARIKRSYVWMIVKERGKGIKIATEKVMHLFHLVVLFILEINGSISVIA
jgi:hypothetical protein